MFPYGKLPGKKEDSQRDKGKLQNQKNTTRKRKI